MKEIILSDKQKYLNEHYPFKEIPEVTDKKRCIHCDTVFFVGYYKVFKNEAGEEFICCPNAPDCDGTVIDWFPADDTRST